jgi:hypothetical protein
LSFSIYPEEELIAHIKKLVFYWQKGEHLKLNHEVELIEETVRFIQDILYTPEREFMELALDPTRNVQMFLSLHLKKKLMEKGRRWLLTTAKRLPLPPRIKMRLKKVADSLEEALIKTGRLIQAMQIGYKIEQVVEEIKQKYPEIVSFWIGGVDEGKASVFLEAQLHPDGVVGDFDAVTFEGVDKIHRLEEEINRQFKRPYISHFYIA